MTEEKKIKNDLENFIDKKLEDFSKAVIEAVNFGFEKTGQEFEFVKIEMEEIKNGLVEIETRLADMEEVIVRHVGMVGDFQEEINAIRIDLKGKEKDMEEIGVRFLQLEKRVAQL